MGSTQNYHGIIGGDTDTRKHWHTRTRHLPTFTQFCFTVLALKETNTTTKERILHIKLNEAKRQHVKMRTLMRWSVWGGREDGSDSISSHKIL